MGDVGAATSPPYDVISPQEREQLAASSPYNVVNVLLAGPDDPSYQHATRQMASWTTDGVLCPDDDQRFYIYFMDYIAPDGTPRVARGVLGALDVMELGARIVPHEETRSKHRADRLAAMTATRTNVDVIIGLSSSPDLASLLATTSGPQLDFFSDDGVRHRMWKVIDAEQTAAIATAVDGHPISIADGHHRYLTAMEYRRQQDSSGPWDAILAYVAPAEGSGLTVGPYHRVFARFPFSTAAVDQDFEISPCDPHVPDMPGSLVVATDGQAWHLTPHRPAVAGLAPPWRAAGSAVAREVLYPLVGVDEGSATYVAEFDTAMEMVHEGNTAILVAPVSEEAIAQAGDLGLRFPSKTTYFIPKPRAGLVMRSLIA